MTWKAHRPRRSDRHMGCVTKSSLCATCCKFLIGGLRGRKTASAPPRAWMHPPCRMGPSRQPALELSRPYVSLTRPHTLCLHFVPNPNQESDRRLRCRAGPRSSPNLFEQPSNCWIFFLSFFAVKSFIVSIWSKAWERAPGWSTG